MGNCMSSIKRRKEPKKSVTLAIVGLDNAGKTTLSHVLAGEPLDPDIAPTVGFRNAKFSHSSFDVTVFDLGGGESIRPIWKTYFGEVFGLIYVLDSSTPARLSEASTMFQDTLKHPQVSGKPVLILANKTDKQGHMTEDGITSGLNLKMTLNVTNCPTKLVMASALKGVGAKMDQQIQRGLDWLFDKIYDSLNLLEPRIEADMKASKEAREKEREERKARVKKKREEREKAEEIERTRLGLNKKEDSDDDDVIIGDPFKALDLEELKEKEQRLKERKLCKQEKIDKLSENEEGKTGSDKTDVVDRISDNVNSLHATQHMDLEDLGLSGDHTLHLDDVDTSAIAVLGHSSWASRLPAIEPIELNTESNSSKARRRKKKKLTDYHLNSTNVQSHASEVNESISAPELTNHVNDLSGSKSILNDQGSLYNKLKKSSTNVVEKLHEFNDEMNLHTKNPVEIQKKDISNSDEHIFYKRKINNDIPANIRQSLKNQTINLDTVSEDKEDSVYKHQKTGPAKIIENPADKDEVINIFDKSSITSSEKNNKLDDITSPENTNRLKANRHKKPHKNKRVNENNSLSNLLSDEENDSYTSYSILKETLCFPLSPTYVEDLRKSHTEVTDLQMSRMNTTEFKQRKTQGSVGKGGLAGYMSKKSTGGVSELGKFANLQDEVKSSEYGEVTAGSNRPSGKSNPHSRKKKHNFLRSNKVVPSDDESQKTGHERVHGSDYTVQELGSQSLSDSSTPKKNRNTMVTSHYTSSAHESDINSNWGLAEDLPAVDSGHGGLHVPNFDSNDEDIVT